MGKEEEENTVKTKTIITLKIRGRKGRIFTYF